MKFGYPRLQFAIKFMALSVLLASMVYLLAIPKIESIWLIGFSIILLIAIAIVTLTPMITQHEINSNEIILRQGLLFNTKFSFKDIETVELSQTKLWAFGLFPAGTRNRIVLASSNRNLVEIKLREKRRFALLLWRSSKEIIIDLNKPDDFVKMANEKLGR